MKNLYLFLSITILANASLEAMTNLETKRQAFEQVETKAASEEAVANSQEKQLTLCPGSEAQNWNSASLAAFYQELDNLPKEIQPLIRQYLIGASQLDFGPFIGLLLGLRSKTCWVTEPRSVSKLSGDALLNLYQEQFSLVSAILAVACEDNKKDDDLIFSKHDRVTGFAFEMPHNGLEKFTELFMRSHPEIGPLLLSLPETIIVHLRPWLQGSEEGTLELYKKCTGSCEMHIDLDSNAPILLQNNSGIFTLVAPVFQEEVERLINLGFEPTNIPQFLTCLRSLQKKLRDQLIGLKLTGKVILAINMDADKWIFSLQQPAVACDEDATPLRKTVWTLSVLQNSIIRLYNGSTGRTSSLCHLEGANLFAKDSLVLVSDYPSVHKVSIGSPLRDIALFTLIQDKFDSLAKTKAQTHIIDELEDYWKNFFDNLNSDERAALDRFAPNLFKQIEPKKQSRCVIS